MLNWSAEADHAVVTPDHKDSLHQPDILKESFDELYKAVKAAIDFHPEYKLRPTTVAIKSEFRPSRVSKGKRRT